MATERVDSKASSMTIGRFSRASRLSLKALRLYDGLGLLLPARVDEATGYRYYLESQLATARLIGRLRRLDMPLQTVAAMLERSGADAARMLDAYWREVEGDTAVKHKLVSQIDRHLRGTEPIVHYIQTRDVAEQRLLSIESRTLADRLPSVIQASGDELVRYARAKGVRLTGPAVIIYHGQVTMDADGPVEVCLPVEGPVEPFAKARVRVEPAHKEAYARITKAEVAFPDILAAYDSVEAWLKQNGKRIAGSPREVMFADWSAVEDDDPACDVSWPFEDGAGASPVTR